jgi:hypothetical protein
VTTALHYYLIVLSVIVYVLRQNCRAAGWRWDSRNGTPNINEIKEFWSKIWSNEVQFNNQAEWIPHLENDIPGARFIKITIYK